MKSEANERKWTLQFASEKRKRKKGHKFLLRIKSNCFSHSRWKIIMRTKLLMFSSILNSRRRRKRNWKKKKKKKEKGLGDAHFFVAQRRERGKGKVFIFIVLLSNYYDNSWWRAFVLALSFRRDTTAKKKLFERAATAKAPTTPTVSWPFQCTYGGDGTW